MCSRTIRSSVGERATQKEYNLDWSGQPVSVIADATENGWDSWLVVYGNVNHKTVEYFLEECLGPVLFEGDAVLNDGASVHLVASTQQVLDRVTDGRHVQVAGYSHDLSPCEKLFSMTWRDIRKNWDPNSGRSPEDAINESFHRYSIAGPEGWRAKNLWNVYARNHDDFVNNF